jgi:Aspartyl/Asparaginyl beta-hydroxylase
MNRTIELLTDNPYFYFDSNPATDALLDNFDVLKQEFLVAAKIRGLVDRSGTLSSGEALDDKISSKLNNSMYVGKFKSINLYITDTFLDEPEKKEMSWKTGETERLATSLLEFMPFSKSYIQQYKDLIGAFNYNISYPGSRLQHHLGLNPDYIRIHYCLFDSPYCVFDIEGWSRVWKAGEMFGFDDGNVFHGTDHKNLPSARPRVILMIDMKKSYIKSYIKNYSGRMFTPTRREILEQVKLKDWDIDEKI